jgi:hypothetical protein
MYIVDTLNNRIRTASGSLTTLGSTQRPAYYAGVSDGRATTDTAANLIGYAQYAALSNSVGIQPYNIVVPCQGVLSTITNAPGVAKCCQKDMSQLFRDPSELIADQGRQAALRTSFNLPKKLDSLRGPIVNGR